MFDIKIKKEGFRSFKELEVRVNGLLKEFEGDIRVNALNYRELLIKGILEERYGPYPDLSDQWVEKKRKEGAPLGFWQYKGGVLRAIQNIDLKRVSVGGYMISLDLPKHAFKNEERRPLFEPAWIEAYTEASIKWKKFVNKWSKL